MTTLEQSYARARELSRRHGRIYYAAALLLPRVKRHHVQALFGLCQHARDVVDATEGAPPAERRRALDEFEARLLDDLARGESDDLVLKAVVHTVVAFDINPDYFRRFLRSQAMDLEVATYETFDDLLDYLDGSAAVLAEMLLPILEPSSAEAYAYARDLGIAMGLTTVLRDVSLDLDRGRVYLPQDELRRFHADPWRREATPEWRALVAFEVRRARRYYDSADLGLALLPPTSARAIRAARRLASDVLDRVERAGGDTFSARARIPVRHQALVVGRSLLRSRDA
jgi:phytoene synthase